MTKDIFKSLNSIHRDSNLSLEEKHLLIILIKYHNIKAGYAYPTYENLLEECSTSRRSKISKIIKALKEKSYIEVIKVKGNKSHYFIKNHLYFIEEVESLKEEKRTEDQVVEIEVENTIKKVKFTNSVNGSKVAKVFEEIKYFRITKWFLDRVANVDETIIDIVLAENPKTAKLFLIKCIERSLSAGLELSKILRNTLNFYSKTDSDYAGVINTQEDTQFYKKYMDLKLGLV